MQTGLHIVITSYEKKPENSPIEVYKHVKQNQEFFYCKQTHKI